jgi:deazaflavin-dependent oxidoreductase (nitroreductase family)
MTTQLTPGLEVAIRRVLRHGHTIDITTTGRVTGEPRRIEIVYFNVGGRLYICGIPNPHHERAWLRNLRANPRFTFHLKALIQADLPAIAREITDPAERRPIIELVAKAWRRTDIDAMVEHSPLVEVAIDGIEPATAD